MAFVHRSERDIVVLKPDLVPGPGSYVSQSESKAYKSYAPFLSTVQKTKPLKKEEDAPGPGTYNVIKDNVSKNPNFQVATVNSDPKEAEFKISAVFKSNLGRFTQHVPKEELPGPGTYYKDTSLIRKTFTAQSPAQGVDSINHKDQLMQAMRVKGAFSIPSIPSNMHGYGYTENESNALTKRKNILIVLC